MGTNADVWTVLKLFEIKQKYFKKKKNAIKTLCSPSRYIGVGNTCSRAVKVTVCIWIICDFGRKIIYTVRHTVACTQR